MSADDIADTVEDYMDEITENFEEFIGKTLILVSVALCSVVLMAYYGINQLAGRSRVRETRSRGDLAFQRQSVVNQASSLNRPTACQQIIVKPCTETSTCTSTGTCPSSTTFKEKVLRDVVFGTSSKLCNTTDTCLNRKPSSSRRVTVTSSATSATLSTCSCKQTTPSKKKSTSKSTNSRPSCCSLCCTKEEHDRQDKTDMPKEKT